MLADSFLATWLASLLLEAGVAGIVAGYWWIGGALVSAGGAILVRRLRAAGIVSARTAQRLQVAASVLALCVGLFLTRPRRAGFADPIAKDTGGFGSGRYRGVILWTEPKPKEIVMARPPDRGKGHSEKEQNWSIPFDGVYWFFKFPDKQPPAGSYTLSGSPAKTAFRSSDFVALQMVARQNFVNPMEMSCCSRMEVGISNSDEYPPSVLMEVILSERRVAGRTFSILGETGREVRCAEGGRICGAAGARGGEFCDAGGFENPGVRCGDGEVYSHRRTQLREREDGDRGVYVCAARAVSVISRNLAGITCPCGRSQVR